MAFGFGNGYGLTRGGRAHPAAAAYRTALIGAGVTPTGGQMAALSRFFRAGDAAGWRTGINRLALPVWGAASPNAICAATLATMTWIGTVSHSSKMAQSTGANGCLDTGWIDGSATGGGSRTTIGVLTVVHNNYAGVLAGGSPPTLQLDGYNQRGYFQSGGGAAPSAAGPYGAGLFLGYGTGTNNSLGHFPSGGSWSVLGTVAGSGDNPAFSTHIGAVNTSGTPAFITTCGWASAIIRATALSDTQATSLANALTTLTTALRA